MPMSDVCTPVLSALECQRCVYRNTHALSSVILKKHGDARPYVAPRSDWLEGL